MKTYPNTIPSVSVIMPLYNGELFIDAAISSVAHQTYTNWNLYIIDDGSKDKSYEKALEWSKIDERITILQHENNLNKGVSASRNLGIKKSCDEFIALIDCDDVWLPDKLSKQIPVLQNYASVGLVYGEAKVIDDKGEFIYETIDQFIKRPPVFGTAPVTMQPFNGFKVFLKNQSFWVPVSTAIFRRSVLEKISLFDETLNYQVEDTLFFLNLATALDCFFIKEILSYYRIHSEQWNAKRNLKIEVLSSFQLGKSLIKQSNKKYKARFKSYFLNNYFRTLCAYFKRYEDDYIKTVWPFLKELFQLKESTFSFKLMATSVYIIYAVMPLSKRS